MGRLETKDIAMKQLGTWSAFGLFVVGVLYAITVAIGMYSSGITRPIQGPTLAIMEILTLVAAPLLVVLMCSIHSRANQSLKIYSSIALSFMILVAGLTGSVHFIGLTTLRQTEMEGIVWPSILYAVELLAWDIFLGLSLLFVAPVFQGKGLKRKIRVLLITSGILCIAGSLGPLSGDMRVQFISILGYGVFLPMVWLLIATDFYCSNEASLQPPPDKHIQSVATEARR